jgi:nucleoside-diphosphate-sugar epimerase
VRAGTVLQTSAAPMVRDYLHPDDFFQLVRCVLRAPPANCALDCYSAAPVDKATLLAAMAARFGLRYEVGTAAGVNATGAKPHYYSLNRHAAGFGYQPACSSLDGIVRESALIPGMDHTIG